MIITIDNEKKSLRIMRSSFYNFRWSESILHDNKNGGHV